jgi:hypothetical protein
MYSGELKRETLDSLLAMAYAVFIRYGECKRLSELP